MMSETVDSVANQVAATSINGKEEDDSLSSARVDKNDENGSGSGDEGPEQIDSEENAIETNKDNIAAEGADKNSDQVEGKFNIHFGVTAQVVTNLVLQVGLPLNDVQKLGKWGFPSKMSLL